METKPWYMSKTVWAGVLAVAVAAWDQASISFHLPTIPTFVFAILGALGVYGRVSATTQVK
jgi:hypothetical protein